MSNYLVCDGSINLVDLTCSTGWYTSQTVDFQDLVALLQFDPEIFGLIFGISILFFVMGHGAGHVARLLARR